MPDFRHRLNPTQQRTYDRSNAVTSIPVRNSPRLLRAVELLQPALAAGDHRRVQRVAEVICEELCLSLRVPRLEVAVKRRRPRNRREELHGLYESYRCKERITVWMYTAKRQQVVAYRTFLRTLLHEVCHHLDYQLLKLSDSFHTDGFFKRESSLVQQVLAPRAEPARPGLGGPPGRGLGDR